MEHITFVRGSPATAKKPYDICCKHKFGQLDNYSYKILQNFFSTHRDVQQKH